MKEALLPLLLAPWVMVMTGLSAAAAPLVLTVNQSNGELDWFQDSSIARVDSLTDNNTFGFVFGSPGPPTAVISSPLPAYVGAGDLGTVLFQFTANGGAIEGIRFGTTFPPGSGALFAGTAQGAEAPVFTSGSLSQFTKLDVGDYTLAPVGPWSDGIRVMVVVPEPAGSLLFFLGTCAVGFACRRPRTTKVR
jgi:hypothetical protein